MCCCCCLIGLGLWLRVCLVIAMWDTVAVMWACHQGPRVRWLHAHTRGELLQVTGDLEEGQPAKDGLVWSVILFMFSGHL
uniref:Secreted protein n=1 Tax=Arundo donax TaxID=35708 RepID=A0A0A9A6D7_ARUDO